MEITKEAAVKTAGTPSPRQLEAINRLTKSPLSAEQLYVVSLRLCDDQPDRDYERFDRDENRDHGPQVGRRRPGGSDL